MNKISHVAFQAIGGANVVSILLMLLIGNADKVDPTVWPKLSTMGLFFPVILAINVFFLVFWALVKVKMVIIPLLGFIVCYGRLGNIALSISLPTHRREALRCCRTTCSITPDGKTVTSRMPFSNI